MAPAVTVDASPGKKRRTEKEEEEINNPSNVSFWSAFDEGADSDDGYVPLTGEYAQLVSAFQDKLDSTGGFDVPNIPFYLLDYVPARVVTVACQNDDKLIKLANTAIRHSKDYITFKARDSFGVVRTYETLIDPRFGNERVMLEIFRVKPYAPIQCPGDD